MMKKRANGAALGAARRQRKVADRLLQDCRAVAYQVGRTKIPTRELVVHLVGMRDRPWARFPYGKALTLNRLARTLNPLGVRPRLLRDGPRVFRGYEFELVAEQVSGELARRI